MRIVHGWFDALRRKNVDEVDNLLLLHPALIEKELEKLDVKSPFYIVGDDEENDVVFIPNKGIEKVLYTEELKYYIPRGMMIPIGGMDGRFCIRSYGTYVDKEDGFTKDIGYRVEERSTGEYLMNCKSLNFLGTSLAIVDNFYITKNSIIHHVGEASVFSESGYFILGNKIDDDSNTVYFLYDANGDFVTADIYRDKLAKVAAAAPDVEKVSFPRNGKLFEKVIVNCLKDRKELEGCTADNLIDITTYLYEHNLELTVGLDTLAVFKANYARFFRRNGMEELLSQPQQYVYKNRDTGNKN